jgi:Ca-activated chloride channel family protein
MRKQSKPRVRRGFSIPALLLLGAAAAALGQEEPGILPLPEPPLRAGSPFLLQATEVRAVITGPVARVEVTQTWENPNPHPVDGLYIFPLPENAAVNHMELHIGERTIVAEMRRREEARALYEQARREGRVAGLLDQERPNVFAQRVANILPGAQVEVVLTFDHPVRCDSGECEYVFPTVVGPRFIPAHQTDPGAIAPPVVGEGQATYQKLTLSVELDAGLPIRDLNSPTHRVLLTRHDEASARAVLAEGDSARMDRDFRLTWRVGGDAPEIGWLAWRDPLETDAGVFTLILEPPVAPPDADVAPRELVFVLDCSGSMSGAPLTAAKNVVRQALQGARPGDTFRIIRFSEQASGLGPAALPATPENIRRGLAYVDGLRSQGGTHMLQGIRAALQPAGDPERLRIVAFLTDGYIGNEKEIFAEVDRLLGDTRLFAFGIGSSVNRYLLEGLAEEGRGTAAFLGPRETADQLVQRFLQRIDAPVLTDIRISWEGLDVQDLEPANIPDLFAGQSLLIHGRYRHAGSGLVVVEGRQRGRLRTLSRVVPLLEGEEDHEALGRLWALARIHRLQRELHGGPLPEVQESIVELGLKYHLMTPWTSLVAVDSEISNHTGQADQVVVPVEMPEDVSREGVFGAGYAMVSARTASRHIGALASSLQMATGRAVRKVDAIAAPPPPPVPAENRERDEPSTEPLLPFHHLTLFQTDGSQLRFEADGEVWWIRGERRTLLGALSSAQRESLRRLLAAASPARWGTSADAGHRLQAEGSWGSAVISLPSSVPAVQRLVQAMERQAF